MGDDGTRNYLKPSFPVTPFGNIMEPAESVKNLCVILDAENSMQRHVANLCCVCHYHLWELQKVCRYITHERAVKVGNAKVSRCLDYCIPLLYHTKKSIISRSQSNQNVLCCIVCKLNKFSHVTPFLHKLHWLPMQYYILFKYNLLTYKEKNLANPHIYPL